MKFLSFILAFNIFFQTVQPAANLFYSESTELTAENCGDDCCSKEKTTATKKSDTKRKSSDNCCSHGACSPFERCACCTSLAIIPQTYKPFAPVRSNDFVFPTPVIIHSNYSAECFRPPEIA